MVYITAWDDFAEKSIQLFRADPQNTRYSIKYRNCDGKLVLKVTDNKEDGGSIGWLFEFDETDKKCLKFKTDQAQDARKMEKLNNLFFTLMARGPEADLTEASGKEQMDTQPLKKRRGRKQ